MKRITSLLITVTLLLALAAPAAAAELSLQEELTAVTLAVKETLELSEDFSDFSGDYSDAPDGRWNLYWSGDDVSVDVTADREGRVLYAYCWKNTDSYDYFYGFDPHLSTATTALRAAAHQLLARLTGSGETAEITDTGSALNETGATFRGVIYKNGLPTPITFTLRLYEDGSLRSFSRTDSWRGYVGETPSAVSAVEEKDARELLRQAPELELYYVLREDNEARPVYVLTNADYAVDAQSGELWDLNALYNSLSEYGYVTAEDEASAADAAVGYGNRASLSEVELASIESYHGALSAEELESALRSIAALGLDDAFELTACSYTRDTDTGEITATLRFGKTMTEDNLYGYSAEQFRQYSEWGDELRITKYIRADAMSGQLLSLNTYYPLYETEDTPDEADNATEALARAFAEEVSEHAAETALCDLSCCAGDNYVYAQRVDDLFYPDNRVTVGVNAASGTVDYYTETWDDTVSFAEARGIIYESAARDVLASTLTLTLGYLAYPVAIDPDDPLLAGYAEWGYSYVEELKTAWYLDGAEELLGIDALTGAPLAATDAEEGEYTYSDLAACPQREAIEALGAAGIGFEGGEFLPEAVLTQQDAAALLLAADGYSLYYLEAEDLPDILVSNGFITAAEKDPEAELTRLDFLRLLLINGRYGDACRLTGVWSAGYADADTLAPEDLGYAAVAEALGLWTEDTLGPDEPCTRAEAAQMLYNLMIS